MFQKVVEIYQDEYWWFGCMFDSASFPLKKDSVYSCDCTINSTVSWLNPLLISNKGRYVYSYGGYKLDVHDGKIEVTNCKTELFYGEVGSTLKDVYRYVSERFFEKSSKLPPEILFSAPQYCTWIDMMYNQTQQGVLDYAHSIIDAGMPAGELIIDDGWMKYYGNWTFNKETFPNPKAMFDELKELGFHPVLWLCNYVSPDSTEFRQLDVEGLLLKDVNGKSAVRWWWNGYSAVLDFSNPKAVEWFNAQLKFLMDEYGVEGFKFDGCDSDVFYPTDKTFEPIEPNEQTHLWNANAQKYDFNQIRQGYRNPRMPITHSLCDKTHSWVCENGIKSIIPSMITAGLIGNSYVVPDMIGGGNFANFLKDCTVDEELVSRWIALCALLPMEQYSLRLWTGKHANEVKIFSKIRASLSSYIMDCVKRHAETGEPIVRSMEYEFPNANMADIQDQFMLGSEYLVAPIIKQGATSRTVVLPQGEWLCVPQNKVYQGGSYVLDADLETLLYFKKQ